MAFGVSIGGSPTPPLKGNNPMTDSLKTPAAEPTPLHLTRTGIMLTLSPVVSAALATIPGLVLAQKDNARRAFRAVVTIGMKLALDSGLTPQEVFGECGVALTNELKERGNVEKEQGATQHSPTLPC